MPIPELGGGCLENGKRELEARVPLGAERKSRTLFRDQIRGGGGNLRMENPLDKGGASGRFDPREVRAAYCL